ncbi:MAG TPA: hypothetical protein VMZ22_10095 [Acidimicrobiales bacterium]|nr:hypothetical protein [Acidimicrobiales bacterium]
MIGPSLTVPLLLDGGGAGHVSLLDAVTVVPFGPDVGVIVTFIGVAAAPVNTTADIATVTAKTAAKRARMPATPVVTPRVHADPHRLELR